MGMTQSVMPRCCTALAFCVAAACAYQPTPGESDVAARRNPQERLHRAVLAQFPQERNITHEAHEQEKYDAIKQLLDTPDGLALINHKDHGGMTPLAWAVHNQHIPTIHLLLEKGADLHTKSNIGMTPLHAVASHNHKTAI